MKESSSNKDGKTQNLTTYAGQMKFSIGKNEEIGKRQKQEKIKFNKIWEYQNEGIPLKQEDQNSKLNTPPGLMKFSE